MGCPKTITYTDGEWTVTETTLWVKREELEQYGGIGADTGWVGNPFIKQYRTIVSTEPTGEDSCCN